MVRSFVTLFQSFWFYQKFWSVWRYGDHVRSSFAGVAFGGLAAICVGAVFNWIRVWRYQPPQNRFPTSWSALLALTILLTIAMQLALLRRELMLQLQGRLVLPYVTAVLTLLVGAYAGRWAESHCPLQRRFCLSPISRGCSMGRSSGSMVALPMRRRRSRACKARGHGPDFSCSVATSAVVGAVPTLVCDRLRERRGRPRLAPGASGARWARTGFQTGVMCGS